MRAIGLPMTYTPKLTAEEARTPSLRLTLEPERVDGWRNRPSVWDIQMMIMWAHRGLTSREYLLGGACRWASWGRHNDLVCTLALKVWPSDIDLEYSLTLPPGVTSAERVRISEQKDTKIWVGGSSGEIELPWLLEDASFAWHPRIGVWDEFGRPADPPKIEQDKARLILRGERGVYGILCPSGSAVGWRHDISITYPTGSTHSEQEGAVNMTDPTAPLYIAGGGSDPTAPGISITNADDIEVTVTWTDEHGERQRADATLVIPDCVRSMLTTCPNSTIHEGDFVVRPRGEDGPVKVYYNACDGGVLDVRRSKR